MQCGKLMLAPRPPGAEAARVRRPLVVLLIVLAVAALGYAVWRARHVAPLSVVLHTVSRGTVETLVANTRAGTIEAVRRAKLAPQIGGQVDALPVKRGMRVTAGQVLLELWNEDLKAQLALAQSEAIRSRALVDQARQLALVAELESQRMVELRKTEIASEEQTQRMIAEAGASKAGVAAAEAAVLVAGDRVRNAEAALMRTVLRAPFAGVVAEINAEVGEYVTPSPPGIPTLPAIDLIDTDSLYAKAPIDEVDAAAVRVDMPARITLDAFRGRSFQGLVTRIAPYVLDREKEARTVDVEVAFLNPADMKLVLPGASTDVEIIVATVDDVLRVPTEAILPSKSVLVLDAPTNTLVARQVEAGIGSFTFTEIKRGVVAGDKIVLSLDRAGVVAGALVKPEAEASANENGGR